MRYFLLLLIAVSASAQIADIIPAERRTAGWSAAGVQSSFASTAGVDGAAVSKYANSNIPNRTVIGANVMDYGAVGDGVTDDTDAIDAAILATPAGTVCYLPAGTYRTTRPVIIKRPNITVRGAGQGVTVIKFTGSNYGIRLEDPEGGMQYAFESYSTSITSMPTSTTLTVADRTNWFGDLSEGENVIISELDDPDLVSPRSFNGWQPNNGWDPTSGDAYTRNRGQTVRVKSVTNGTGTTASIEFEPAVYSPYTRTPKLTRMLKQPLKGTGIESLTVYATAKNVPEWNLNVSNVQNCWLYDVESDFATNWHLRASWSLWFTVQKCYFHDAFIHSSGSDSEVGFRYRTSASLLIDNIVRRLHAGVMCDLGASGNVIAYNYVAEEYSINSEDLSLVPFLQFSFAANHGTHPQFNLYEGNFGQKFVADDYWGTSSHITIFRNFFSGTGQAETPYNSRGAGGSFTTLTNNRRAIDLWWGQSRYSVVGNILGDASMADAIYKVVVPTPRQDSYKYIWQIDYPYNNIDSDDTVEYPVLLESGPKGGPTLIDHGNYDPVNGTQMWASGLEAYTALPKSLFLTDEQLAAFVGDSGAVFEPSTGASTTDAQKLARLPAYVRYTGAEPGGATVTIATLNGVTLVLP